ncbi:MAG: hypothetical protein HY011_08760 [Acidobacteria bacterium]|nr:hypothetical protein [Acidobacteriota bacterium]
MALNIKARLNRIEQQVCPADLSSLSDAELLKRLGQAFTPADWQQARALASRVKDVPAYVPGMNLTNLSDAQLCALFLARVA